MYRYIINNSNLCHKSSVVVVDPRQEDVCAAHASVRREADGDVTQRFHLRKRNNISLTSFVLLKCGKMWLVFASIWNRMRCSSGVHLSRNFPSGSMGRTCLHSSRPPIPTSSSAEAASKRVRKAATARSSMTLFTRLLQLLASWDCKYFCTQSSCT